MRVLIIFQVSFFGTGTVFVSLSVIRTTHLNALVFASLKSSVNVVDVIPPAASRAEAKNNMLMVTTTMSPLVLASEANAVDADGGGNMIFYPVQQIIECWRYHTTRRSTVSSAVCGTRLS